MGPSTFTSGSGTSSIIPKPSISRKDLLYESLRLSSFANRLFNDINLDFA